MGGEAAEGVLERFQGCEICLAAVVGLEAGDLVAQAVMGAPEIIDHAVEMRAHGVLAVLGVFEAGKQADDRLVDARDREGRPGLGGLDAAGQPVEGASRPVGCRLGGAPGRLARRLRPPGRTAFFLEEKPVQVLAKGHALVSGGLARRFPGAVIYPLDAPRTTLCHGALPIPNARAGRINRISFLD